MRGPRTFIEVLNDALYHILRYDCKDACGVVFRVYNLKFVLHFDSVEEFSENLA